MRIVRPLLGPLLAGSMLLGPESAPAAARDPIPADRWIVDWGEQGCYLMRRTERWPSAIFVLRTVPGSRGWDVVLIGNAWSGGSTISWQPSGEALPRRSYVESTTAGDALVIYGRPPSLLETVAAAQSIRVERNGRILLEIPFPEAAQAVAALRQCEIGVLRDWGIDPVAYAAIRVPPRGDIAAVVSDADYPPEALRAGFSGRTVVRLMIDTGGRVSDCATVASSGHAILDTRTCEIYRRRLRLSPAVGADGAPTAAALVVTLRWLLPNG
jgi:TonB family protein